MNLEEAAQLLQVKCMTVLRLVQRKILAAETALRRDTLEDPLSRRDDLDSTAVRQALIGVRCNDPLTPDPGQGSLDSQ